MKYISISQHEPLHADPKYSQPGLSVTIEAKIKLIRDADISENQLISHYPEALEQLLRDHTTKQNIFWATDDYEELSQMVVNAGSVFLGHYACESAGDYVSGTNHTLPTNSYARAYSGVNLDSYNRKITFQHLTEEGIRSIGKAVEIMAANEHLDAHKNAMTVRIKSIGK